MSQIVVGAKVTPRTPAGLWLADVPCDGTQEQARQNACVLTGEGIVLDVQDIMIDYDTWSDVLGEVCSTKGLGQVAYRSCLLQCTEGIGWAGAGALVLMPGFERDRHAVFDTTPGI